jgi:two-component system NtrC family sensor kinase
MMDRSQLQQVVLNLLNNAEYAIHTVADSGRIRVATRVEDGWILLSVEDDGPGIGREVARRAFDPFFTTKPVGKGSGLGLSICFGIIDDHGGEIRLDPELGRGARFDVRLPVTRWRPDDEELPRDRAAAGAEPAGAAARRRVLFVDDEEAIRLLGREYLGSLGHEVVLAEDGAAALGKLERYEFDIVLCDCRMPRMDGEQFYRTAVERSPRYRDRFVFMTGDAGTTVSGFREGVGRCPVIAKPFDLEELRRILSR